MKERTTTDQTCMYYACMPHIQIRNVPPEVHDSLVRQAAGAGKSLQQYLLERVTAIATTPSQEEILDRIERHATGKLTSADAIAALRSERARR